MAFKALRARLAVSKALIEKDERKSADQAKACVDLLGGETKLTLAELALLKAKVADVAFAHADAASILAEISRHEIAIVSKKTKRVDSQDFTSFLNYFTEATWAQFKASPTLPQLFNLLSDLGCKCMCEFTKHRVASLLLINQMKPEDALRQPTTAKTAFQDQVYKHWKKMRRRSKDSKNEPKDLMTVLPAAPIEFKILNPVAYEKLYSDSSPVSCKEDVALLAKMESSFPVRGNGRESETTQTLACRDPMSLFADGIGRMQSMQELMMKHVLNYNNQPALLTLMGGAAPTPSLEIMGGAATTPNSRPAMLALGNGRVDDGSRPPALAAGQAPSPDKASAAAPSDAGAGATAPPDAGASGAPGAAASEPTDAGATAAPDAGRKRSAASVAISMVEQLEDRNKQRKQKAKETKAAAKSEKPKDTKPEPADAADTSGKKSCKKGKGKKKKKKISKKGKGCRKTDSTTATTAAGVDSTATTALVLPTTTAAGVGPKRIEEVLKSRGARFSPPGYSIEASRSQLMCRTGFRGLGQSCRIPFGNDHTCKDLQSAKSAAEAWLVEVRKHLDK